MTTTTDVPTATQPDFHVNNVLDHPGSTWAGAGILMALVGFASQNPLPTTALGWISYGVAAASAVLAALGK